MRLYYDVKGGIAKISMNFLFDFCQKHICNKQFLLNTNGNEVDSELFDGKANLLYKNLADSIAVLITVERFYEINYKRILGSSRIFYEITIQFIGRSGVIHK